MLAAVDSLEVGVARLGAASAELVELEADMLAMVGGIAEAGRLGIAVVDTARR